MSEPRPLRTHTILRILHVCPRPSFSGLEAYALAVASGQKALGHDVTLVVLANSPLAEKAHAAGLKLIQIAAAPRSFKVLPRLHFMRTAYQRLSGRDHEPAPDIVHLHSTQDLELLLLPLVCSRLRIWLRSSLRSLYEPVGRTHRPKIILQNHIWISHSKRDPLHAFSYFFIDEVWCSSQPARKSLERLLPIPAHKLRVVNYGREIERLSAGFLDRSAARAELKLPMEAIVIGAVARIDKGKGTAEFIEAGLNVMATEPRLHLVWIGPPTADDPKAIGYSEALLARVAALPDTTRSRLHFPGAVANSYRLLKAFDLFALPTYKECFSLSLLEAQLAGLPVLGTQSGGTPEVVVEQETGWLFEPESITSLQSAIELALKYPETWTHYGVNAERRVRADFDFAQLLPQTIENYCELL